MPNVDIIYEWPQNRLEGKKAFISFRRLTCQFCKQVLEQMVAEMVGLDTLVFHLVDYHECLLEWIPKLPNKNPFHVSFTFLVLLFWAFLVRFSGPPTPSCQKE